MAIPNKPINREYKSITTELKVILINPMRSQVYLSSPSPHFIPVSEVIPCFAASFSASVCPGWIEVLRIVINISDILSANPINTGANNKLLNLSRSKISRLFASPQNRSQKNFISTISGERAIANHSWKILQNNTTTIISSGKKSIIKNTTSRLADISCCFRLKASLIWAKDIILPYKAIKGPVHHVALWVSSESETPPLS